MKSIRFIRVILVSFVMVSSAWADDTPLTGTPIGSKYGYDPTTRRQTTSNYTFADAFDGNTNTFFSAWETSMAWAGLDLGSPHIITGVAFRPQTGTSGADKMLLGVFEGANQPDFMDAVPLYLIGETPEKNTMTRADVSVSRGFRYVRYVGPANTRCVVAELAFYGTPGEGSDSLFYQVTDVPTLSIHVQDGILPLTRGEDFEARSQLIYDGGTLLQDYPILFRVRGNYSSTPDNKAYRVKFNDGKSHHMMKDGINESPVKAKKWVLINSFRDKTLMRNPVAWEVSRRVGLKWTPWYQVVDLLVNGEYRGTYTLADHVSVSKGRIDITEMTAEDTTDEAITGGYFVEVDNNASREPYWFTSAHGNPITVHDPDDDVIQPEQFSYIKNAWNEMEGHVYSDSSASDTDGFGRWLDMESFLRYFLASEYNGNTDMLCQVFFYKERGDDHFYTGPVWDHELALDDDITTFPANEFANWTYTVRCTGNFSYFVSLVLSHPDVMARLQSMWAELREAGRFKPDDLAACVDSLREQVRASARLNFIRWPYLNQYISLTPAIRGSWEAEVDVVRDYVYGRVAWMDNKLGFGRLQQQDGIYQINTPLDLITFAMLQNGGELEADATVQLNADLDMAPYAHRFQPVGTTSHPFSGTFLGQGHVVDGLTVNADRYVGFFGVLGDGAAISGLHLGPGSSFTGTDYVGAVAGRVQMGTVSIVACLNEAAVAGRSMVGAMVGGGQRSAITIDACANMGSVAADSLVAALVGWNSGKTVTVRNCFNTAIVQGAADGLEFASAPQLTMKNNYNLHPVTALVNTFTADQMASGELCWLLNQGAGDVLWRQNLDISSRPRDAHPFAAGRHAIVYALDDGTYSNTNPNQHGYRYYKLDISEIMGTGIIQLSEFDLLDDQGEEIEEMIIYRGIESTISHENWPNMGDNDLRTKFCSHLNDRSWFLFDAGAPVIITGYRLYTANDTQQYSDRNPISWTLSVSDTYTDDPDDPSWQVIDERSRDYTLQATNYTPYDFEIEGLGVRHPALDAEPRETVVYDLAGRPVLTLKATRDASAPILVQQRLATLLPPGLYIVNGQKMMVK
ncbi:MAG: CotH kinase family protein [Bacteroidaceae bacterium]|nr:CotH kinase family protein [Bacteroidaceae bacterium]